MDRLSGIQLPPLDTNIVVILILVAMGLYGLFAGKQRLRILILSVYVGIVLAEQVTAAVAPMITFINRDQVGWLLLALPILIFGLAGVMGHKSHQKGHSIANIIVGLLTGALIVSSALHILPTSAMAAIDDQSFIAMELQQFHLWILGLLPIVALLLGFMKRDKKH